MNALIDTESKSYREGYTKAECYGYADLCTYFIDSQAKFDAWVANTAGNDYSHIIIKGGCGSGTSGAYETTTTINLTATGTNTIQGVNNATIKSTAGSGITNSRFGGWIRDLTVKVTSTSSGIGFSDCTNLTNCSGIGTGYGSGIGSGFSDCTNLTNCTGDGISVGGGNGIGFSDCTNLTKCTGTGSGSGSGSGSDGGSTYGYGYYNCTGVSHCAKNSEFTSTTATFDTATCCANQGTYSSTYKVANTANGGFNDLT
jgi:hypothetical protein